ncbi:MAG: ClbS/DfsB family four-helix bundle protein [Anaerolineae bacterium]|nr:ClbS/DfsB family four-helix bundle protein [Anaerolineae bacterium]
MPRPVNKEQLLTAMQKEHGSLTNLLATLSPETVNQTSESIENWTIKDVLSHVTAWEQMVLSWYQAGLRGDVPELPAPGFNWRQIPALNQQIYEQHQMEPYDLVQQEFDASYEEMLATVNTISNEDLFTPERFAWTNKNTMGTYFVSATSSHYVWAQKEIRKCLKR